MYLIIAALLSTLGIFTYLRVRKYQYDQKLLQRIKKYEEAKNVFSVKFDEEKIEFKSNDFNSSINRKYFNSFGEVENTLYFFRSEKESSYFLSEHEIGKTNYLHLLKILTDHFTGVSNRAS